MSVIHLTASRTSIRGLETLTWPDRGRDAFVLVGMLWHHKHFIPKLSCICLAYLVHWCVQEKLQEAYMLQR